MRHKRTFGVLALVRQRAQLLGDAIRKLRWCDEHDIRVWMANMVDQALHAFPLGFAERSWIDEDRHEGARGWTLLSALRNRREHQVLVALNGLRELGILKLLIDGNQTAVLVEHVQVLVDREELLIDVVHD